jgi:hypothetical protein
MVDADRVGASQERCQAQPAAARRGFREDVLCASMANTTVRFRGREVPVCEIHARTFARWGDEAEANAELLWGWRDQPVEP